MKPVAIFRFAPIEGPGYLAEFLDAHHIPWQMICIDAGEAVPHGASVYSGLVFMGGPMSVNDDLPWIAPVLALIREAVEQDIPLLGHCLGGQLISKALGGVVSRNSVKEIGWGEVTVAENDSAHHWFGGVKDFTAFHWHGETFSLPNGHDKDITHADEAGAARPLSRVAGEGANESLRELYVNGATLLLSSAHCANQAYALGKHLALQCHVEMTAEMIADWCAVGADEIAASCNSPAVQSVARMQQPMADNLPRLHEVAAQLYSHWIKGLSD